VIAYQRGKPRGPVAVTTAHLTVTQLARVHHIRH